MVISLTGLIGLQASLLGDAWQSKEDSFRRNVQAALGSVADALEDEETIYATMRVIGDATEIVISSGMVTDTVVKELSGEPGAGAITRKQEIVVAINRTNDVRAMAIECDTPGTYYHVSPDTTIFIDRRAWHSSQLHPDSLMVMFQYSKDSSILTVNGSQEHFGSEAWGPLLDSGRFQLISRVMDQLGSRQHVPIEQRLDSARLTTAIRNALDKFGISLEPVYAVIAEQDSSLHFQNQSGFGSELKASEYQASLFPHDILAAPNSLSLYFPERGLYLFKQIGLLLAMTVMFMAVVVFGFGYTVKTVLAQQRTTRQMVEFVNNMTHEFKTPISTVALACEAILRPDVISEPDKVARFSKMIQDENRRMRHQAEKILQMAALEEQQGELKLSAVDLHAVIENAVESIQLQVASRNGRVSTRLSSRNAWMQADEVHLTGIIFNLLDNANKYSPDNPDITVSTEDHPDGIRVTIADQGIGMASAEFERIFEKYYRVPSGNVHDVKGFGLGLSYVSLMVKAHGGRISVRSKLGRGTEIDLVLPVTPDATPGDKEAVS
jgi:two-component system phosphate regulon sensor histidine kinase PhoR